MGQTGAAWLQQLDAAVSGLAADWDLRVGQVLGGGSSALAVEVIMPGGVAAILKVAVPGPDCSTVEADILRAAEGRGYARLYHHNRAKCAMVIERLGPPMWQQDWPPDQQMLLYCAAVQEAWNVRFDPRGLIDGAGKAAWLEDFISRNWDYLGRPCSERTVSLALDFAARRGAAFDPARAVICHGDAHPGNLLAPLDLGGTYRFIDPEAAFIEPEYDLGCWLRGWRPARRQESEVGRLARAAAEQLAARTGTDAEAVWEWGLVERVSSGLLLTQLGHEECPLYLSIAEQITNS
ncbi:MAG: aminoglycoside phosphotransferase family protein [Dehalococcoidia bacterium]|nr:phosphotransferase [Dehalococcoidia bacterium]MCA9829892.1 phosphotransferase [Dehalococcoidia bacterium]MCB9486733.1 phosphotransferase [Thermoflexaceae bacterium]